MALETNYISPNIILTTRVTQQLKDWVKYNNCVGLILQTFFFSAYALPTAMIGAGISGGIWYGVRWYLKKRPTIILNGRSKKLELAGITKFGKAQQIPYKLVEKVTVMADVEGRARGQYVPQLVLRGLKGSGKNLVINCFAVEDIIQAHYMTQILATFARADAFDFKGNALATLPTAIPTRFRAGRKNELKSVAKTLKKAKAEAKTATAGGGAK